MKKDVFSESSKIGVIDIEVYEDWGDHTWAQAKYLVHGFEDVLWTNSIDDAILFFLQSLMRYSNETVKSNIIMNLNEKIEKVESLKSKLTKLRRFRSMIGFGNMTFSTGGGNGRSETTFTTHNDTFLESLYPGMESVVNREIEFVESQLKAMFR